jgi:signal transduction histidine kinase
MPVQDAWAEAGQRLKDTMRGIAPNQKGAVEDEWRFFVERESEVEGGSPWLEETYLKWSMIPIVENNQCLGFMHPVAETTSVRLWERRMKMLIELGDVLVTARDVDSYWEKAIQELASIEPRYDIPLAILYTVEDDPDPAPDPSAAARPAKICRLAGTLGVPENHPIAPSTIKLRASDEPLSSSFSEAVDAHHPTFLQTSDGTLPEPLLEGLQWRGFEGDPCRAAVICPIRPTKEDGVMGFLLLGLNPRRPYDNDYRQFISLLSQKLATSLASVMLLEEEARRGRNAAEQAAFDQAMLKEKLEVQTKEANESLQMFEAVAEFVPVGMSFGDPEGNITYANDAWYKITGHPGTGPVANQGFLACVKEEDHGIIIAEYEKLKTVRNVEFEFRVRRQDNAADPEPSPPLSRTSPSFEKEELDLVSLMDVKERYVLASARAEYAADGSLMRVLTCLTDVTPQKRAAGEALSRAQQAENLKRMAEFATVGLYDMDLDGRLLGANKVFFEMCGLRKVDPGVVEVRPWHNCVFKDDISLLTEKVEKMVVEDKVQNVEVRLNTTWTADDGSGHKVVVPRWVQATLLPVRTSEGIIQSFTGCLSDVSLQKWQLDWEKERKEEAIESKRQQENFIDMTSHEMRNPLSAIIHCADAITANLCRVQELLGNSVYGSIADVATKDATEPPGMGEAPSAINASEEWATEARELVENCIDNAETIVTCAQHQKRIVDDILTMSKLDSSLISITRVMVDPIKMVKEALKMFEVEARRVDINLSMVVDPCYYDLDIKYLSFDPSRLKQVLINLLTNALKFTKTGPTRNVTVAVSASLTEPTEASSKVSFIPRSQESLEEIYDHPVPLNRANPVFLMFEVEDTGEGLTDEEKKSLFQRFVQASSRTHVKYGGSGLGLFISRRLTELQHGKIGVSSYVQPNLFPLVHSQH